MREMLMEARARATDWRYAHVGMLPSYCRQDLMRPALLQCLQRMQVYGMKRACASTGIENWPAIRLYESVGFKSVNHYLDYVKPG